MLIVVQKNLTKMIGIETFGKNGFEFAIRILAITSISNHLFTQIDVFG